MIMRKRVLVLAAGLLMVGSLLTVSHSAAPAEAVGSGTTCKNASGRAKIYDHKHVVGYLNMRLVYCWEYFGSKPVKMTSAKVKELKLQMPPDQKDRCLLTITKSETTVTRSLQRQSALVWKVTAQGVHTTRVYHDTYPRDCKVKYQITSEWHPVVAISLTAGGKVSVSAPSVRERMFRE